MKRFFIAIFVFYISNLAYAESGLAFYGQNILGKTNGDAANLLSDFDEALSLPNHYGLRYSLQTGQDWWFGFDFIHKPSASQNASTQILSSQPKGEIGNWNILSAIAKRQFENPTQFTPYVGAGLGIAIPNLGGESRLEPFENLVYEMASPSGTAFAGIDYDVGKNWSIFSELKLDYSAFEDSGQNALSVQSFTQDYEASSYSVNIGVRLEF